MTLDAAAERCVATFLSGPVGGVGGAIRVSEQAAVRDIITFDMGGTSTDVALVQRSDATHVARQSDRCLSPALSLSSTFTPSVRAAVRSSAWVPTTRCRSGRGSAGALPGPACYGRGGTEPTISDANLLLGRLSTERVLAGG